MNNELLFNTTQLLNLLLQLDMFNIISKSDRYPEVVDIMISLFRFDR